MFRSEERKTGQGPRKRSRPIAVLLTHPGVHAGLAALMIAVTNLFNRLNATTRQVAGAWG